MSKSGLGFRLSDAAPEQEARPANVTSEVLSEADATKVLQRLPPIGASEEDQTSFALRPGSRPAPRAGKTVDRSFPPPPSSAPRPAAPSGPLRVTRHLPEGAVDLAPTLSVSFSSPMVAVTSVDDLSKSAPPISLTPAPSGKWRWLGTQTAVFEPALGRFPMATDYKVAVAAGTRSEGGAVLTKGEAWTFSTPTLKLSASYPAGSSVDCKPTFFAAFNQGIDPRALAKAAHVTATPIGGGPSIDVAIELAPPDAIEADAALRSLAKAHASKAGESPKFMAFHAVSPLPTASTIRVIFPAGSPSAEGPKTTPVPQQFSFSTYGAMALARSSCGWQKDCPPLTPFSLEFSNAIDTGSFDPTLIKVSPSIQDLKLEPNGASLVVRGITKGRTKYTVTVAGSLKDRYGQTLGSDVSATFAVGSASPIFFREDQPQVVLDPASSGKLSVFSVNRDALHVRLATVTPQEWPQYLKWRQAWDYEGKETTPPGHVVFDSTIRPKKDPDALVETEIGLGPALKGGFGQVLAMIEPVAAPKRERWQRQWFRQWIQVTAMGLDSISDRTTVRAWATSLSSGAPLEGVEVSLLPSAGSAKTQADGVALFDLKSPVNLMVGRRGEDLVMLSEPRTDSLFLRREEPSEPARIFTFDDRHLYKPGEDVHIKGWLRKETRGLAGDLVKMSEVSDLAYNVVDPRGSRLTEGTVHLDGTGGFDVTLTVPKNANLGTCTVNLELSGSHVGAHYFEIEEFRRPEFEVGVRTSEGPHLVGGHAVATVSATYYAGGGLSGATTNWRVTRSDASFTPPNLGNYAFGKPAELFHWWRPMPPMAGAAKTDTETWSARTSSSGEHALRIDFDAVEPAYPMSLALEASVTDVNRQEWTARGTLLVHPGDLTVGLRAARAFVRAGEALAIDAIASDLDGKVMAGQALDIRSARLDSEWSPDGYKDVERDVQTCAITSAKEAVHCSLATKKGGRYAVTAVVSDVHGRKSQTRIYVWVADDTAAPDRELQRDVVQLLPDKTSYAPGDTAEVLLLAPFAPAEGVLTLEREGIAHFERFSLTKTSQVLRFKIEPSHLPSIIAGVHLVGMAPRTNASGLPELSLPKRPAHATGTVTLAVPPKSRTLAINAIPRSAKLDPGATTSIDLDVRAPDGKPAQGAVVALAVVDESILALSGAKLPDPIAAFYVPRTSGVRALETRDLVSLAKPLAQMSQAVMNEGAVADGFGAGGLGVSQTAPGGGGRVYAKPMPSASPVMRYAAPMMAPAPMAAASAANKPQNSAAPIALRKDFAALALWAPHVVVDGNGHATVPIKLPESLTRYRIIAVGAAAENWFGSGESSITARLPLMVRPSATRFLNYGDRLEFPIVVQNQTDAPLDVLVAARASNARMLDSGGRRVKVPANDRVEVRVPVAAEKAGTARFQIAAASGTKADASELSLPVWTPATTEAFATYGVLDEGAVAQPVAMPSGVVKEFGALEIDTSSTGLQGLTDAVLYLTRYPFDCNEQIASRILSIAALRDVLSAFDASSLPKPAVLTESIKADLEKLRGRQHYSGGFSFWGANYEPYPWISIHVAHAIARAKAKGYNAPGDLEVRSRDYLRSIETHIPSWYTNDMRRAVIAYALYVRNLFGDADSSRARRLIAESGGVDKMPIESLGFILAIVGRDPTAAGETEAIRRFIANHVTETAGAAHFVTGYGDSGYVLLHSDRRADGVLLEALIGDQKDSPIIPKLVTGLLGHRKEGRWTSTQESAFVLLALDRYFETYEKSTPNFVGRAWLGDKLALERDFRGRSTDRQHVRIPLSVIADLTTSAAKTVTMQKDGVGRLYYRIGMQYAPADLRPPPSENGFSVSRLYEAVDDPSDVRRDPDGTYRVKAGALVRVRIGMVAPSRRVHVALVDPLPAGFEALNPALATTATIPQDPSQTKSVGGAPWWWGGPWYEHQNVRDERVEAFASLLFDGVYDYTYVARATTPGTFVAAPPKAEEMYNPETFGRAAGDRVVIE